MIIQILIIILTLILIIILQGQLQGQGQGLSSHLPTTSAVGSNKFSRDTADRIIHRIKGKLRGYEEESSADPLGVGGHVQQLISEAQDPSNLSKMYFGWAPWL